MFRLMPLFLLTWGISWMFASEYNHYEIINLGGDCQIAYQMHINGIRKYALPFDKIICTTESLMQVLQNNFAGWLEKDKLELVITERSKYVLDATYQTRWLHDFKLNENFINDYDDIYQTYQRRIQRYRTLVGGNHAVVFLRKNITKAQALELRDLLSLLYPAPNFVLVVLESSPDFKEDWGEKNIINLFLTKPVPYHWKGDDQAWRAIFTRLGFDITSAEKSTTEI
ncbi:hypothetical protein Noda2021_01730 [Candidatus Dependentiae bacterium Noda2021]|nr:hypothetical protein Noda2021_01730 [Candidatus Dependentiae bacterium Noda2021]